MKYCCATVLVILAAGQAWSASPASKWKELGSVRLNNPEARLVGVYKSELDLNSIHLDKEIGIATEKKTLIEGKGDTYLLQTIVSFNCKKRTLSIVTAEASIVPGNGLRLTQYVPTATTWRSKKLSTARYPRF
jgi:hypothetical protein